MGDTIDLYHAKGEAEREARRAWEKYTDLVQNGGTGEERLTALRAAMQADRDSSAAARDWRAASGINW